MQIASSLTIATRGSRLALWQATYVKNQLLKRYPDISVDLLVLKTKGDIILDVPLAKVGGKGLFVKEIEEALLDGRAHIAVHSMKDVPMELPAGLTLGVIPKRANFKDLFLSVNYDSLEALPQGAKVGTSSLRRQSQLLGLRPDLNIISLRGNVETRLRKLTDGEFDAIIMAAAGMERLGLTAPVMTELGPPHFLPACGQGAIGLEYRSDNPTLHRMLAFLNDVETFVTVNAERGFLAGLEGGCQVPIAAYAQLDENQIHLEGLVASPDGTTRIVKTISGPMNEAYALGKKLAEEVKDAGAAAILKELYTAHDEKV